MAHNNQHTKPAELPDELPDDAVVSGGDDPDAATIFKDRSSAIIAARSMHETTEVETIKHNGEQRAIIQTRQTRRSDAGPRMEVFVTDG